MRALLDKLRNGKLAPIGDWIEMHPRLSGWIALSSLMLLLLIIEASDVGLRVFQWIFLTSATLLIAWLCVWIISWDETE